MTGGLGEGRVEDRGLDDDLIHAVRHIRSLRVYDVGAF